jgi:S-sulfo-L-cysteine synthase (O-acetyl-L-serine-dependent)
MATTSRSFRQSPAGANPEVVPKKRAQSVLDLIGNTPLLEIRRLTKGLVPPDVRIFAKLEGFNPGGSVKDRAALKMIQTGIKDGKLKSGKVIIDSTSGNTGIALAMIGATLRYSVELVMAENVSKERKKIIQAFGAKIHFSDPLESSDGAILKCREIIAREPERYFKPDQYNNEANALAHFETTGPEIWRQTEGQVTHFVAAVGTSGTVMGTGRFLKTQNRDIRVIGVEPDDAMHGLEGMKHIATSIVPGIFHRDQLDEVMLLGTEESYEMVYALGQTEGILVGQSSGAAMIAALRIAQSIREGVIVTIFPDFGDRYLSTNLWIGWREWRRENLEQVISKWNASTNATT